MQVAVVGSLVVDIPFQLGRWPDPGESMLSHCRGINPGGKGLNQAVGLARLGVSCALYGAIGQDTMGRILIEAMEAEGLSTECLTRLPGHRSGIAVPLIREDGGNAIVVDPGVNMKWERHHLLRNPLPLKACQGLLIQLEVPQSISVTAATTVHQRGGLVILDPAPFASIADDLWQQVDILTPNADELSRILGTGPIESLSDGITAAKILHTAHPHLQAVVVTLGRLGVAVVSKDEAFALAAEPIRAVDETAAGDGFNAGLAYRLLSRNDLRAAVAFANRVGAWVASHPGSMQSLPRLHELEP